MSGAIPRHEGDDVNVVFDNHDLGEQIRSCSAPSPPAPALEHKPYADQFQHARSHAFTDAPTPNSSALKQAPLRAHTPTKSKYPLIEDTHRVWQADIEQMRGDTSTAEKAHLFDCNADGAELTADEVRIRFVHLAVHQLLPQGTTPIRHLPLRSASGSPHGVRNVKQDKCVARNKCVPPSPRLQSALLRESEPRFSRRGMHVKGSPHRR